ncbi:mucin-1 isoform X2 [Megalops cyprinoides]|uniref:mucin-1 isoform X2 n=1 Tax=Megalops cyprinoides TaxID=118141 RepID=UPI0018646163|nr:mucin-1 isoform X2 [Megalops cyprinoides]
MKPDGVDTAAMEPVEVLVAEPVAEAPALGEEPQQAPPPAQPEEGANEQQQQPETQTAPPAAKEGSGKPGDLKAKTKGPAKTKTGAAGAKATGASGPGARPGATQNRIVNGVQKPLANGVAKKTNATAPEKKKPATTATNTAAPSKRPVATVAASSTRTPTKAADRKPVGATRPASAPSGTNSAKPATGAAQPNKKPVASPVNGVKAKPKTAAAPRPASAAAPKPSTAAATKTDRPAVSKTTRPPGGPPASRPAPTTTAAKPATASSRPASSKAGTTAPSAGRSAVSQPTKPSTPAKKDVSKPTAAPAKKPAAAPTTRPAAAKTSKPEAPKPATAARPDPSTKKPATNNKADTKPARPKPQEGKPAVNASPRAAGPRPGLAKTTAAPSPKKPVGSSAPMPVKRGPKPSQAVQPLAASGEPAKKAEAKKPAAAAAAAVAATAAAAVAVAAAEPQAPVETEQPEVAQREEQMEMPSAPAVVGEAERAPADVPAQQAENLLDLRDLEPPVAAVAPLGTTVLSPPSSPPGPAPLPLGALAPPESPAQEEWKPKAEDEEDLLMQVAAEGAEKEAAEPEPLVAVPTALHPAAAPGPLALEREEAVEKAEEENNVDEDEEEDEREGSQQVSVSDMSGTQPTEESRPGSAGLAGSMWRGGALLSELDSEEVSGSQQGASELSAPGVLEGTESMDDLGDASLKGADGEGGSAGSPDIETVPDIPANEEEDDDDDEDQVYDMEVGSERVEDPRRVRHEGEDEEEDEDVEMASEGVTESGLESYGNADEDDFAEDERLDNLNRAQAPPLVPTAPPAQWSQTNPFADPWAQPPQPAAALLASPSCEPWAADPETPTQSPAQAWLELSSAALVPQFEEPFLHPQALQEAEPRPAPAAPVEQESSKPLQPPAPLAPPARGMSQSSTLSGTELAAHSSSETSTPEELRDYNSSSGVESRSEEKQQQQTPAAALPQPDTEQDLGIHMERGDGEDEEEAETLPADEVLGGPPTAPASAPSSPSTSGDEASDTEGEMQINEPDAQGIDNIAFDSKPGAQNLPALEEREEAGEGEEGGDTPQSANSVASYGFDCTTTSNSNAHSTAESCGKSPGIFSLENEDQLPEEAKDPSLIKELTLPAAATADADDLLLLGAPVDLLPVGQAGEAEPNPEEQQYMLCGKLGAELSEQSAAGGAFPQEPGLPLTPQHSGEAPDVQPPYYSAICEKTDNVLSGNV